MEPDKPGRIKLRKTTGYRLEIADGPAQLVEKAQRMIREGWEPQGGLVVFYREDRDGYTYAQAWVQYDEGP